MAMQTNSEPKTVFNGRNPLDDPTMWVSKDGTQRPLSKLNTKHVVNIIAKIDGGDYCHGQSHKRAALVEELRRRGKNSPESSDIMKLITAYK